MNDKEYKSYKRGHKFSNPSEKEKGKIKKEKIKYTQHGIKAKDLAKKSLKDIKHLEDFDEGVFEEIEDENFKTKKEKGNLNTHKKRLKSFQKYEDFE